MSIKLSELLGEYLGSIRLPEGSAEFAHRVVVAASKHNMPLASIAELKYADLNGDGKIEEKEIATLVEAAHQHRTGTEFTTVSSGAGLVNGRAVPNPSYDPSITNADMHAMSDKHVVKQAKVNFQTSKNMPSTEELLQAIGKDSADALKGIRGGHEVLPGNYYTPSDSIRVTTGKQNGLPR